jgi:glyoxylase-like metal-dependent hydrolase (beta-lactamase superfamily II)
MSNRLTDDLPLRRWTLGSVEVTQVSEAVIEVGLLDELILGAEFDEVMKIRWLYPDYANASGQTLWNHHVYVLDVGDQRIMVDTGVGNHKDVPIEPTWGGWETDFFERLESAGILATDIDIVLCTHMHVDHVGWNTRLVDGAWLPTFPNAAHIFARSEFEFHSGVSKRQPHEGESETDVVFREQARLVMEQSIEPLARAGMIKLVEPGEEVAPGVRYIATHGHTPGHCSVAVESDGRTAVITGDFIHHPLQIARPGWSSRNDHDVVASARLRQEFLESCVSSNTVVFGTHFAGTSVGTIAAEEDGFRLVPWPGDPI